jgi:glycerol-3-phosphate dehydrogenase
VSASGTLDVRDRSARFARLDAATVDLVVIGAGITGAGIAFDAATRGLSVVLVDASDIAAGTSSRSSKMIHGGLRYLAQGDVELVREAASERQVLRRTAPHLARMCPFVVPGSTVGTTKMRAGLAMFEKLGKVPRHERHEVWDGDELGIHEPTMRQGRFSGAVVYPEFLTNDARLTLANVRAAVGAGASVLTHAPVTSIIVESGRAVGIECRGALPGETLGCSVRARVIVNAAGPWVDVVRALESTDAPKRLTVTKGIHVVVPRDRLPVSRTIAWGAVDRRSVFAVPSGEVTYLGTTDSFHPDVDEWPAVTTADIGYLVDEAARTFDGPRLDAGDVVSIWSGIRPLIGQEGRSPSEISRKDEVWVGPAGVISIAGGKLTAYRKMAQRVVDDVVERLGVTAGPCATAELPLHGGDGDPAALVAALSPRCGEQRAQWLVDLLGTDAPAVVDAGGDLRAEVHHAITADGALTLTDIWVRRLARAWFTLDPIGPALTEAAAVAGPLLGWDDTRQAAEIDTVVRHHTDALAPLAGIAG